MKKSSDIHTSQIERSTTTNKHNVLLKQKKNLKRRIISLTYYIKSLENKLIVLKKRAESIDKALEKKPQEYKTIFGETYTLKKPLKYQLINRNRKQLNVK